MERSFGEQTGNKIITGDTNYYLMKQLEGKFSDLEQNMEKITYKNKRKSTAIEFFTHDQVSVNNNKFQEVA